jgi:hypothetical protein
MNVLEVLLFFKELSCNSSVLSLLELCSTLTSSVHCVHSHLLCYSKYLVHKNQPLAHVYALY